MSSQRERQVVNAPIQEQEIQKRVQEGWRMVAIEWERDIPATAPSRATDVPFGLQLSPKTATLEQNANEWQALLLMMEMTVQEGPYWTIAEELNRRGFRTRQGQPWTPISVFEMLPRLIEVGPRIFSTDEWRKRRQPPRSAGD